MRSGGRAKITQGLRRGSRSMLPRKTELLVKIEHAVTRNKGTLATHGSSRLSSIWKSNVLMGDRNCERIQDISYRADTSGPSSHPWTHRPIFPFIRLTTARGFYIRWRRGRPFLPLPPLMIPPLSNLYPSWSPFNIPHPLPLSLSLAPLHFHLHISALIGIE